MIRENSGKIFVVLAVAGILILFGLVFSSCNSDDKGDVKVAEETPTPTLAKSNPLNIRGTATISMSAESMSGGVYKAQMYEAQEGEDREQAVVVDEMVKDEIGHKSGLPTQWDFRLTIPNFKAENSYFVYGAVTEGGEENVVLLGKCDQSGETLCRILGEGKLTQYYMDLVSADEVK